MKDKIKALLTAEESAARLELAKKMRENDTHTKGTKYRYLYPLTPLANVPTMRDVGILADGTLHNPNGYPEDVVRVAVLAAIERKRQRRSESAKKAARTRAIRKEQKVYEVARKLQLGHRYGPTTHCIICNTEMTDPESIERGIGPCCFQLVMAKIQYGFDLPTQLAEADSDR